MRKRITNLTILVLLLTGFSALSHGGEMLRDPTRPYVPYALGTADAPRFAVNAIIVSSARRVAIVNGRRVSVGGSVDGATVITIEKDHLILEKDGERITAGLNERPSRR
ncbi:MAG: general secretion pathway protein GspB [Gammaproteobacteria bacterium]|nr:general secretion pathway protein GspB [Gammaproteobacteria bacterium]MDH3749598.1 general secretion pathway protein GspB [Gammaproteobacteria bacterium]MDH3804054.1 general secretion pathway protein GspB [Gammaproteobacteria bacterium]